MARLGPTPRRAGAAVALAALGLTAGGPARPARAQEPGGGPGGPTAGAEQAPRFLAVVGGRGAPVRIDPDRTPLLSRRIAVDVRGQTVAEAVETVARAAGMRVVYSPALLPADRRVALQASGISVASALAEVLMGTDLDVLLSRTGQAALVRRGAAGEQPGATVAGQVTDSATRRPLAGARVSLGGTAFGATTNDAGQYRIVGVPAGSYTLAVRRLGYAPARRPVVVEGGRDVALDVRLTVTSSVLDQVVVTGTVVPTERRALPSAITVVDSLQIARRNITTITQLFRGEVPGLFAANAGVAAATGRNQLGQDVTYARGSSTIDGNASPLKVYVDGVEQANFNYLSTLDPRMIERVEILTGPQASTIYGAQAINGVMQVFTKRGAFNSRPRVSVQAGYGVIQNSFSASLAPMHDHSVQLDGGTESVTYRVGGLYTATGQWTPGASTRSPIGTGALTFRSDRARLTADVTGRFAYRDLGTGSQNPVGRERAQTGEGVYSAGYFVPPAFEVTNRQQTIGLTLRHAPTRWWSQTAVVGDDQLGADYVQQQPYYSAPSDTLLALVRSDQRKTSFTYNSTLTASAGRWLGGTLTLGGDYWQFGQLQSTATVPGTTGQLVLSTASGLTPTLNRRVENNGGLFAQAQVAVADLLYLTVGSRWDRNTNFGGDYQFSQAPRYGVSVARTVGGVTAKLRTAYGRSIRPPETGQRDGRFSAGDATFPGYFSQQANLQLGPEFQRGWEHGVELGVGAAFTLSVSRYDQTVEDLIGSVLVDSVPSLQVQSNGQFAYRYANQNTNIGTIRNRGWEGTASAAWRRLSARGTWTRADSRLTALNPGLRSLDLNQLPLPGDQYGNIPASSGAFVATYTAPRTTVTLTTNFTGQVRRDARTEAVFVEAGLDRFGRISPATPRTPESLPQGRFLYVPRRGFALTDLNALQRLGRGVDAFVRVTNLGNQYTPNDLTAFQPVQGRTTLVGMRRAW